jgi:hypothetical protein
MGQQERVDELFETLRANDAGWRQRRATTFFLAAEGVVDGVVTALQVQAALNLTEAGYRRNVAPWVAHLQAGPGVGT